MLWVAVGVPTGPLSIKEHLHSHEASHHCNEHWQLASGNVTLSVTGLAGTPAAIEAWQNTLVLKPMKVTLLFHCKLLRP